ncbi:MAG: citrate/2-methylcitrate synthase, partial [Phycisphaeraceae bacterium]|nr:citrate/2-methylcitrate synthase [Phycisphaeraceae bacterium]
MSEDTGKLELADQSIDLPIVVGSEGERGLDISKLRGETGHITLDSGYGNTGSCQSSITFIDGENGILRYRGIPIEQLATGSTFVETAWLLIFGDLPTEEQLTHFRSRLTEHQMMHERMYKAFDGFPSSGHPMAILSAMINATSCYHPEIMAHDESYDFADAAARIISKTRTIAAASYKTSIGQPIIYPRADLDYCSNFLHMMFSRPYGEHDPDPDVVKALNMILILHADHEQNCSTSTVRMVASSHANMFAAAASGVCALWGPRHGGANAAVIDMLEQIHDEGLSVSDYVKQVKDKETG